MSRQYPSRFFIPLRPGTSYTRPRHAPPEVIHLDNPALHVMTDFRYVVPQTVSPEVQIDVTLERMKKGGVRLLLVTDTADEIVGLVTANDIMGDKPVRLVQEQRVSREQIRVEQVMQTLGEVSVLDMRSVDGAQVGHIVETLHGLKLQHILVVEVDDQGANELPGIVENPLFGLLSHRGDDHKSGNIAIGDSHSGDQRVRGLFSTSQISKQLHRDISQDITAANTLSEIVHETEELPDAG
jgi:CBS domain-containing protein